MTIDKSDEEYSLPRATVDKLVSDMLPPGITVSREIKGLLRESAQSFLLKMAGEANRICEVESKKTITHEHVYKALEALGFGNYIDECKQSASDYEDYAKLKPSRQNKFKESGLTMDQLHEEQMKLFSVARENINKQFEEENEDLTEDENKDLTEDENKDFTEDGNVFEKKDGKFEKEDGNDVETNNSSRLSIAPSNIPESCVKSPEENLL